MIKKIRMAIAGAIAGSTLPIAILMMYASYKRNRSVRYSWCNFATKVLGIEEIVIRGSSDLEAKLYTINHRSLLDIIVVEAILPKSVNPCWIAKKEIAKIPIYGHILNAPKMITIDRENRREIVKLLKMVETPLSENRPLMIFPEGTRNKGDGLLKFKSGAKMLAEKHNLKVQPVVIRSDDYSFDPKKGITKGRVFVEFLPSVDPTNDGWYEKLESDMNEVYKRLGD